MINQPADQNIRLMEGAEIERKSRAIAEGLMAQSGVSFRQGEYEVARRVLHATADASFLTSLRFSGDAVERGIAAIRARRPVICDVRMLAAGCTHGLGEVICLIHDPAVTAMAAERKITRASAAMRCLGERLDGAVVAIGNAPTALFTLLDMARDQDGPRPALVVGMPVGFVGAEESKTALSQSDLPFITNLSARGGSPSAAAVINALADLARQEPDKKGEI